MLAHLILRHAWPQHERRGGNPDSMQVRHLRRIGQPTTGKSSRGAAWCMVQWCPLRKEPAGATTRNSKGSVFGGGGGGSGRISSPWVRWMPRTWPLQRGQTRTRTETQTGSDTVCRIGHILSAVRGKYSGRVSAASDQVSSCWCHVYRDLTRGNYARHTS